MTLEHSQTEAPRRVAARYEGCVQGVGFRITTVMVSRRHPVSGYVCNLYDGSVRVVAEGTEAALLSFLRAIKLTPLGRRIDRESLAWSEATGEFEGFDIRLDG